MGKSKNPNVEKNNLISLIMGISLLMFIGGFILIQNTATNKKPSEEQKIEILNKIKLYEVNEKYTFEELKALIDKNLSYYNPQEKDIMIHQYITQLYSNASSLNNKLSAVGYDLEKTVKEYNIDVSNKDDYQKIPDNCAMARGFLEEVYSKGFLLEKPTEKDPYRITLNDIKLNEEYGKKVTPSFSKLLEFGAYEKSNNTFINVAKKEMDLTEVCKRINMIESGLKLDKKQDYKYCGEWMDLTNSYYAILTGMSHDYFLKDGSLKQSILEEYKKLASLNKNKQVGTILNNIIDIYAKNNNKINDDIQKQIVGVIEKETLTDEIKKALDIQNPAEVQPEIETK